MIKLISSLAHATDAQLGYDPNMTLLGKDDKDKWRYQITIKGKDNNGKIVTNVYKTTDMIADTSSNLRGRATRVYEAYDVKSRTRVVIKDSWVDANRPKEADVLSEILDGASEDEKALFLTVLLHGVVTIDGNEDLTQDLLMNGYLVTTDKDRPIINIQQKYDNVLDRIEGELNDINIGASDTVRRGRVHKASIFELLKVSTSKSQAKSQSASWAASPHVSTPNLDNRTNPPPRVYGPKAHYRIVFKEKGTSLHRMSRCGSIKLLFALQAMLDITKGNLILSHGESL